MADNQYKFTRGTYRVITSRLNVRGIPDSTNDGNLTGIKFTRGKEFPVFAIEYDKQGFPWGVITQPGAAQAHYVCLWNGNTRFAELVSPLEEDNHPVPMGELFRLWAEELDVWARSQGYKGRRPSQ